MSSLRAVLFCFVVVALGRPVTVSAAAAHPFDLMLSGTCFDSRDWSTAYSGTLDDGTFQPFPQLIENLAEAPRGRVFGFANFHLVEVLPDRTIVPLLPDVVAANQSPVHMVVGDDGTTYVLPLDTASVRAIAPNGGVRDLALPPADFIDGGIDLAADQCTLFYLDDFSTIKRFNVCTEAPLPDFATVVADARDVRVLPDGGVLVATYGGVLRYGAGGNLVRTYPIANTGAIGLADGGRTAFIAHACKAPDLIRLDLESGATQTIPFQELGTVDIIPRNSWTAALGSHLDETVPTMTEFGVAALCVLLALAAFLRLR
jgi:hypothetical protein